MDKLLEIPKKIEDSLNRAASADSQQWQKDLCSQIEQWFVRKMNKC